MKESIFNYQSDRTWCRKSGGHTIGRDSTVWYQNNARIYLDEYDVEEIDNNEFEFRKENRWRILHCDGIENGSTTLIEE
jgi:hypothetical protein